MKERDEELALFIEMQMRDKENENNNFLRLLNSENEVVSSDFDFNFARCPISRTASLESEKSDYDWLVTPPGSPLFPCLEKESKISLSLKSETEIPNSRPKPLKPRVTNILAEPASRRNVASKTQAVMSSRRSSSSSSTSKPSTPFRRPKLPSTIKSSRPSSPTSRATLTSARLIRSSNPTRTSSASNIGPSLVKNPVKVQGLFVDAPSNLKAERAASTSSSSRLSSLEADNNSNNFNGKSKRLSLSSRSCLIDGGDHDESPVMIGTKMVKRIVNMRKLAPPKLDADHGLAQKSSSGKSSISDSSGFGRTLSSRSLDMAMRHMDIRHSIQSSLKPFVSSTAASSLYSIR